MTQKELYSYRCQAQLTQSQLAAILGVHQTDISRWETNFVAMPREALERAQKWAKTVVNTKTP